MIILLFIGPLFQQLPIVNKNLLLNKKCKVFARNANSLQEMQILCKNCKNFIRFAKNLQRTNFLTSGVNAHLGGLGGK